MLTRCPYIDCSSEFTTTEGEPLSHGQCPQCKSIISYRPLEQWQAVDRRLNHQVLPMSGGPQTANQPAFCAVLEDVRSLWNVGSIFRTADGAGMKQLFLCGITGTPPRPEIAKTSLGAEETISWHYRRSVLDVLPQLKAQKVLIVALERPEQQQLPFVSQPLEAIATKVKHPLCLVVGNEVNGLSAEALALCDLIGHLPMRGMKESLNVAVAFGIAAYCLAAKED